MRRIETERMVMRIYIYIENLCVLRFLRFPLLCLLVTRVDIVWSTRCDVLNGFVWLVASFCPGEISCSFLSFPGARGSVWFVFLHARYIPDHEFEKLFYTSVSLMSARQDDMSPSGNTCPGSNL